MGTKLGPIIKSREISLSELNGKIVAVDAFNTIYQFLTTIRQYDGTPLKNSKGEMTSHLSGLFFRTTSLMKQKIKPVFVFDGISPDLKEEERERRKKIKKEAIEKYNKAVEEGDVELMKKYASRTVSLTEEILNESKELLAALGVPIIQAPSEGEAQAAYMVKKGDCYALVSQDTDGLLFGATRIIKNLSISGKKKKQAAYQSQNPEMVILQEVLEDLGLNQDQLIVLAILSGTDFNVGGVKGIGPKKALTLIKENQDKEKIFKQVEWDFEFSWEKVYDTIVNMKTTEDYMLKWNSVDENRVKEILIGKGEFSEERVDKVLEEITKTQKQKGLSEFF